jgi:hypothetical protein
MKTRWTIALALMLALTMLFSAGCDEEDGGGPELILPNDTEAADEAVAAGNAILGSMLYYLVNNNPEEMTEIDVTPAYVYYDQAIQADADHVGGHFGIGLLEVLTLTQDTETQDFIEALGTYFESGAYFLEDGNITAFANPGSFNQDGIAFALTAPMVMMKGMTHSTADYSASTGDMQAFARQKLLPRLGTAIHSLNVVAEDETFVFTVTPQMQGDMNEDPVELDLTEVHGVLAVMYSLRAMLQQFVAYDLDLGDYTGADMQEAFSQNSDFAALTGDGESRMESAQSSWLSVIQHMDAGLTFLENEADNQADDLIRMDPYDEGISAEDIEEIRSSLTMAEDILTGPWEVEITSPQGGTETLTISLNSFFTTPVANLKNLFPGYTVDLAIDPEAWPDWNDRVQMESDLVPVTVTVEEPGYYYWSLLGYCFKNGDEYIHGQNYYDFPELDALFAQKRAQYANEDFSEVYVSLSQYLESGENNASAYVEVYTADVDFRYVPVITWDANSGSEWILPDPTVGGFLPDMTDEHFKELVGWNDADFEKTTTLHLWEIFNFSFFFIII